MSDFKFNGDWEYQVRLPAFAGFQSRFGYYTSKDSMEPCDGNINLTIEDDLSNEPDPSPEQLDAIEFIIKRQQEIVDSIVDRTLIELPEILSNYGLEDEEQFKNIDRYSIKKLIGISGIEVKISSLDGLSYFDVRGGCEWDEEHGLNVLMHKTRTITFGGIDSNSYWDAVKDNGTYEYIKDKKTPKKYEPHPKYGKLKPSQKFANETYEIDLISGGFNSAFIDKVKSGEIDINGKWESQNKSYLEAACWYNNNELVKYLLDQKAELRYAIHQCLGYNTNPEAFDLILENGGDINVQDLGGKTVLHLVANELTRLYDHKQQSIQYGWNKEVELDEKIELQKEKIKNLISKGANPDIKDRYQFNVFDLGRNLNQSNKQEYIDFIDNSLSKSKKKWK